jgi:hypothetical protein
VTRPKVKRRRPKVKRFEGQDGQYITVEYTRDDGERVLASYKFAGWERLPSEELAKFMDAERKNASSGLPIEVFRTSKESGKPPRDREGKLLS